MKKYFNDVEAAEEWFDKSDLPYGMFLKRSKSGKFYWSLTPAKSPSSAKKSNGMLPW